MRDARVRVDAARAETFKVVANMSDGITSDDRALVVSEMWFIAFWMACVVGEVCFLTFIDIRAGVVGEVFFFAGRARVF